MTTFEDALARDAAERHIRILADARPPLPPMPPSYRLEDRFPSPTSGGFIPLSEAGEAMGMSRDEVLRLAERGVLAVREVAGVLYVQPAIVSVLAVRENDDG